MRRRPKTGGKAIKTQRRKAFAPNAKHSRRSLAGKETNVARLTRERDEALEQQAATSEVLKVVSSSPSELKPVFDAILEHATRICEAKFGTMWLREGDAFRVVALHNAPSAYEERRRNRLFRPADLHPKSVFRRFLETGQVIHIADLRLDQGYLAGAPTTIDIVDAAGARTGLMVPMLKDNELVGSITIYRQEVRPFTDTQIELVQNFATQAVIAIENARLLNELRRRTDDLSQALQQQTATSEVLRIISSSPGELKPVFNAMLANATRICEAKIGLLYRSEGDVLRTVAMHDAPRAYVRERQRDPIVRVALGTALGRALATKQPVQIADISKAPQYLNAPPGSTVAQFVKLSGARTTLGVPMLKDNELVGAITLYRQEVRPFTDKQIELVQNFAAQAVIAIENARLLNELRQRTDDLSDALDQQTATSEVLKVISSSPGRLTPVFEAILENAVRLCVAKFGTLWMAEKDDHFRSVASHAVPPVLAELRRREPVVKFDPSTGLGRVVKTKQVVHVNDMSKDPAYLAGNPRAVTLVDMGGARTVVFTPMLKNNEVIGALTIYRQEVRPFTDKQIELVQNFAAQAVIAIENARLLDDLNKLNQQLEQRVTDQVGEIERMGRLRRFLPPQVADLIVASGTEKQLESHRREITALFCDLRGFTGFSESSDPEDVMTLLREYHAAIGGIINKYGGTLERYAGDGVMVVFNDPIPVDNPALQAVLMAIEMRAAIEGLIEKWRKLGHDIGFGIGIAHGFATLGTIGFEGRFDYAAIGTVSNVASRLCDEAKPGQILISPRVLMAVEKDITVEPVGEFALKGIRRPMTAYNVLEASLSKPS
jgi:GAF domain-containing protein